MTVEHEPLTLGVDLMDRQHRRFTDLVKHLLTMYHRSKVYPRELEGEVADVLEYAIHHFEDEEALMRESDYPHYEEHCARHDEFRHGMFDFIDDPPDSVEESLVLLNQWMVHWFQEQVVQDDVKFVEFLKANEKT